MNTGRRVVRFDPFRFLAKLEKTWPGTALFLAIRALGLMAPFNAHLKARMIEWSDGRCVIRMRRRRGVRNHVGCIHAGALFTLGETCAGLVIIRNFPFENFRPLMSDVRATYFKQARTDVTGSAEVSAQEIKRMLAVIEAGDVPFTDVVTTIVNDQKEAVAAVTTTWQVKQWNLVRPKKAA